MKPRDVFGIIVRTAGLSTLICGMWELVFGIATLAGMPGDQPGDCGGYFMTSVLFLSIGLYLLRGAPGLLRFAYPTIGNPDEINSGEPESPGDARKRA